MKISTRNTYFKGLFWLLLFGLLWWAVGTFPLPVTFPSKDLTAEKTSYIGNMNGVELSIPTEYIAFPVEYTDKSVWEPNKGKDYYKKKGFSSGISNFSIYVQWPELKPRLPENQEAYYASRSTYDMKEWFMVGIQSWSMNESSIAARRKKPRILHRAESYVRNSMSSPRFPEGVSYTDMEVDPLTGLHLIKPIGPGTEKFELWNRAIYWSKSKNIFIRCTNGAFPDPKVLGRCTQNFLIPEWQADVSVTYQSSWLISWEQIQEKVRNRIKTFEKNSKRNN